MTHRPRGATRICLNLISVKGFFVNLFRDSRLGRGGVPRRLYEGVDIVLAILKDTRHGHCSSSRFWLDVATSSYALCRSIRVRAMGPAPSKTIRDRTARVCPPVGSDLS